MESPPPPTTTDHRDTIEPAPPPTTTQHRPYGRNSADTIRDVVLWRRKKLSIMVQLVATAIYVALEVYKFKFITVVSWLAMFIVTVLFLGGNIYRLLAKEVPDMSRMEMSEKTAMEIAYTVGELMEQGFRWLLRIGGEGDLFAFGMTVGSLWLLSFIATRIDLLTFLYTGVSVGMSVPVIYVRYEQKIKDYGWKVKMQSQRCLGMIEEKLMILKSRMAGHQKPKDKKTD